MPNKIIGYSPFYLNYGYHPTVPSDLIDGSETAQSEFLNDFVKRMDIFWTKSATQIKNAQEVQAKYYNKHHRMVEFDVSNLVLLSTVNFKLKKEKWKFKRKFIGKLRLDERIGLQSYRLKLANEWKVHNFSCFSTETILCR